MNQKENDHKVVGFNGAQALQSSRVSVWQVVLSSRERSGAKTEFDFSTQGNGGYFSCRWRMAASICIAPPFPSWLCNLKKLAWRLCIRVMGAFLSQTRATRRDTEAMRVTEETPEIFLASFLAKNFARLSSFFPDRYNPTRYKAWLKTTFMSWSSDFFFWQSVLISSSILVAISSAEPDRSIFRFRGRLVRVREAVKKCTAYFLKLSRSKSSRTVNLSAQYEESNSSASVTGLGSRPWDRRTLQNSIGEVRPGMRDRKKH